ncbi:MAG TPA: DUF308 domain-containing protein [Sphingomicrobium sp.]|nr:DUF308 domain-containing protein [Sphingomicrobium sp.]
MTETQATADVHPGVTAEASRNLPAHNWGWFLFRGLLALVVGILAILYPFSAVTAFALLFAAFAFVDGIGLVISGISGARNHRERWVSLVLAGVVGIAVGVIYLVWPALATISYALILLFMIAAWALVSGVAQIAAAIRLRDVIEGEWLLGLSGLITALLGLGILYVTATVPGASILSVGWMIGFYALIVAVTLIALALRLKRAKANAA